MTSIRTTMEYVSSILPHIADDPTASANVLALSSNIVRRTAASGGTEVSQEDWDLLDRHTNGMLTDMLRKQSPALRDLESSSGASARAGVAVMSPEPGTHTNPIPEGTAPLTKRTHIGTIQPDHSPEMETTAPDDHKERQEKPAQDAEQETSHESA